MKHKNTRESILITIMILFGTSMTAQTLSQHDTLKSHLTAICTALESYKVDANGYPETLEALFPTYIKEKPLAFLESLDYEVDEDFLVHLPENPFGHKKYVKTYEDEPVYERFLLTHEGTDNIKGTADDIVIDTHKVTKQPDGSMLEDCIIAVADCIERLPDEGE